MLIKGIITSWLLLLSVPALVPILFPASSTGNVTNISESFVGFLLNLKKRFSFQKNVFDLAFCFNQFQYKAWHCNSVCVLEILNLGQWVRACYTREQTKGHRALNLKENSRNRAHVSHQKTVEFSSGVQKDFVHGYNIYKALTLTNQSNS